MKTRKRYGIVDMNKSEYVEAAAEAASGSGVRIDRPLVKVDGVNLDILSPMFELPSVHDTQNATLEVAFRIVGFPVTQKLLNHLPQNVTEEHIGQLLPYMPFTYHRRFGVNWTDYICPESTRSYKCPVCAERIRLFRSEEYRDGKITKDDIIKEGGFGTRMKALFFAQVYFDNTLTDVCPVLVDLTNERVSTSKGENFFDKIEDLSTQKKLLSSETLPRDYYADGDGGRWLVAEYKRAVYPGAGGRSFPFWKLDKITPTKELTGLPDPAEVWWPEVKGEDGASLVDVYEVLNVATKDELSKVTADKVDALHNFVAKGTSIKPSDNGGEEISTATVELNWPAIVGADATQLVTWGVEAGLDAESLTLIGEANIAALRRNVAKAYGVVPTPTGATAAPAPTAPTASAEDTEIPF